jgi:aspartokinase
METIAFYREAVIKTYGLVERTDLCLVTMELPSDRMEAWGTVLADLTARLDVSLLLLLARPLPANGLRLLLLLDHSPSGSGRREAEQPFFDEFQAPWRVDQGVELVYFQGPHYGDRYGIASAALDALAVRDVPVLAMACTGASVYLITPQGKARPAQEALGQAFMTPETENPETGI